MIFVFVIQSGQNNLGNEATTGPNEDKEKRVEIGKGMTRNKSTPPPKKKKTNPRVLTLGREVKTRPSGPSLGKQKQEGTYI